MHWDEKANEDDLAIANVLAKEIESIVQAAATRVDEGSGLTKSSKAYLEDSGSKAAAAKRGTAIHAETYDILGEQLRGFGVKEHKCTNSPGRMDLVVNLPSGSVIVYDITSCRQAEMAHTSGRGYEKEPNVIAVIEISYDDDLA